MAAVVLPKNPDPGALNIDLSPATVVYAFLAGLAVPYFFELIMKKKQWTPKDFAAIAAAGSPLVWIAQRYL
jgi:hypothetical protein